MTDWSTLDATAWREAARKQGAVAGVQAALTAIDSPAGTALNAFTVVLREEALRTARELDNRGFDGRPLWGVPVAIKEEVDVAGCVTTFGTRGNVTPRDADSEIVRRLRQAGAIIIGKTAMPAFGAFPFTESEAHGVTVNPHDPARTPGGSSGGTAAAVAGGLVPVGIGGDGGGSIRIPSAHCGLVGLKPRRGVVPTAPYQDLWCALGTSGALTRSARDTRLLFDVLADAPTASTVPATPPANLRIALDLRPLSPLTPLHKENRDAVLQVAQKLRALGHTVEEARIRSADPTPAFYVQFFAGIRQEIAGLEFPERIEGRHKRTALMGAWATPKVVDWARHRSEDIGDEIEAYFSDYDALLTPTVADRPVRAGILSGMGTVRAQLASLPSVAYTARYNVSGHPAIALPAGRDKHGLPLSVQLVGSRADTAPGEGLLLTLAEQLGL
ncbi:amidase family protein [uncultured Corynebacterium sp.]|uniref:amidase family protein n=1 Tax=uncultured Corynebacterium sp. TaxID=159447 RepID=UPI0025D4BCE0|nr:amidase family protein [uncultured Corynebacterium sp.]